MPGFESWLSYVLVFDFGEFLISPSPSHCVVTRVTTVHLLWWLLGVRIKSVEDLACAKHVLNEDSYHFCREFVFNLLFTSGVSEFHLAAESPLCSFVVICHSAHVCVRESGREVCRGRQEVLYVQL